MASIKDVAKKAGVGIGTVSRVINNSGPVKQETRERILGIIEELDYTPNEMARSFKKQKTKLVGLMVPMINHPFYAELAYYVEDELFENGYKLMLCSSSTDREKEIEYLQMLKKNQVDGIITISYHDIYQDEKMDVPIVTIDRYIANNIPLITSDNYAGGMMAAEKLLEAGCKKLVYVGGEPIYQSTVTERKKGFIDVAKKKDIQYSVFESSEPANNSGMDIVSNAEHIARDFVKQYPDVDGILTSADVYAYAVMNELKKAGKRIPEDVKLIGFDGVPSIMKSGQALSTIKQPMESLGRKSAEVLIKMIEGNKVSMKTVFPIEYIDGETCK